MEIETIRPTLSIKEAALVLFSGGQDSTVCLAWALSHFPRVETVGFAYGQRHAVELEMRETIRQGLAAQSRDWEARLGADHLVTLDSLGAITESALTRNTSFEGTQDGLPSTFVPGRNLLFFTYAAAIAYACGVRHLVGGMCETDYSGYPDCRDDTLKALQVALNLGMNRRFVLHTPLMWIDKAETWRMTHRLGGQALINLVRESTHSCYRGDRVHKHDWGYGCETCPACVLRAEGYARYIASP